jgi:predicted transposase YdaD
VIRKAVRNGEAIGEARGEAIGMAKGEARAKRQVARSLLLDGMAADKIAKITGLGIEEIKGLTSPENVEK